MTVSLGSTLSAILLQESLALAQGTVALALLIAAQYGVTFISVRSSKFADLVRSEPALLAKDGRYCEATMRRERITKEEALSAIRANGGHHIDNVATLILESDGSMSVALALR